MATAAELVAQGFGGYQGWGDAEANADFNATGGSGKWTGGGGGSSSGDMLADTYSQLMAQYAPKPVKPYDEVNPFSFDEALAKDAATKEYSPYYDEMLTDYTSTVERTKSRSQEDLQKTLEQLAAGKEYYMGTERRLLDNTTRMTNNGYAGQGLFFSGARQRDINDINTAYGAETAEYQRQYEYGVSQAKTAEERTLQDVTTAASMYSRDTERAKQTAIEQGILQRKSEAVQQYEMGRTKYYDAATYGGA